MGSTTGTFVPDPFARIQGFQASITELGASTDATQWLKNQITEFVKTLVEHSNSCRRRGETSSSLALMCSSLPLALHRYKQLMFATLVGWLNSYGLESIDCTNGNSIRFCVYLHGASVYNTVAQLEKYLPKDTTTVRQEGTTLNSGDEDSASIYTEDHRPGTPATDSTASARSTRADYEKMSVFELSSLLRQRKTELIDALLVVEDSLASCR